MTTTRTRRGWVWLATIVVILASVVALNWEKATLALAFALSESRPALLTDARWEEPATARRFLSRFGPGTKEGELLGWLESNEFNIDRRSGRASRVIAGLPCNERIDITWSKAPDGAIASAEARVSEAGCL